MNNSVKWLAALFGVIVLSIFVRSQGVEGGKGQPFEILSFKVTSDYYPMLDRGTPMFTADNPDLPRTEIEARTGQGPAVVSRRRGAQERARSNGKLRSQIKVIGGADNVNLSLRNTSSKLIDTVEWDFAFPRFVDGTLVLRYTVSSKVEIKPGGKKNIRHPLPPGATRCKTVTVKADESDPDGGKIFEAVCGPGVDDPSHLRQETVLLKRIRYVDGSLWEK